MTRTLIVLAALSALASCAQYQEPEANCFAFRASVAPVEPDCVFTPFETPEAGVEV